CAPGGTVIGAVLYVPSRLTNNHRPRAQSDASPRQSGKASRHGYPAATTGLVFSPIPSCIQRSVLAPPCTRKPIGTVIFDTIRLKKRDCSRATGFIQPVHDEVMQGFVDALRLGLPATCPVQGAHGSALACAPDRRGFASCDSADCHVPPHWTSRVAAYHRETSGLFPTWGQRVSSACPRGLGTSGRAAATWPVCRGRSGSDSADRTTRTPVP